jgi:hypothetical protein
MAKKTKYPAQKLTEEDKEILDQIFFKYALTFYALIQKYPDPKKYAEEVILKKIRSDENIATLYTIGYARNYPSDHKFTPGEINKTLANDIRRTIPQAYLTLKLKENEDNSKGFLHPRDLRERVLKKLEDEGIFRHWEGKEEIRRQELKTRRPGKKRSYDEVRDDDHGGKQSAYKVTEGVKNLKKAMEKPGAIDFLYEKLIKSGLALRFAKFEMLAHLHAIKMNETAVHKMMGVGASLIQGNVREKDTANFKIFHQGFQLIDDDQLEQWADNIAKSLIEDRGYYELLSISGFLKLNL